MTENSFVKADLSGLEDLLKQLGANNYVKVGVLGSDATENRQEVQTTYSPKTGKKTRFAGNEKVQLTNSELAIIHEFGSITRNIPTRSFLRMPIETKKEEIKKFANTDASKELIVTDLRKFLKKLGILAEGIIDDAFASGGFGKWQKNAPSTIKIKGSSVPLIDTAQLRRAITSQAVVKGAK